CLLQRPPRPSLFPYTTLFRSWEAGGPNELALTFAAPQPSMPAWLSELPIVPAHLLRGVAPGEQRGSRFGSHPVGNGPYRFVHREDRKSTRLNSSHVKISYAVF